MKKSPPGRALRNTGQILSMIFRFSPLAIPVNLLLTVLSCVGYFYYSTYILKFVVSAFEDGSSFAAVTVGVALIVGGNRLFTLLGQVGIYFFTPYFSASIERGFKRMIYEKSRDVELACYENPKFYDKYVKASEEAYDNINQVMNNFISFCSSLLELILFGTFLSEIDPVFILFALIPLLTTFIRKKRAALEYRHHAEDMEHNRHRKYAQRVFYMSEYAKEMRLTNAKNFMMDRYDAACEGRKSVIRKYGKKEMLYDYFLSAFLDAFLNPLTLAYAAYRTFVLNAMTVADCVVIINSVSSITYAFSSFLSQWQTVHRLSHFVDDLNGFLHYEPKIVGGEKEPEQGELALNNVSFTYEGSDQPVLKNVNIRIGRGEKIALVGHNGAGKSTLVKLMLRLYDPTEGTVTLNGEDIRGFKLKEYRAGYATVFQDCKPVALSVMENVLMRPARDGDEEKVVEALKQADVYERVASLPHGIHTVMSKEFDWNGAVLSGGEAQKLALAHAYFKDAPFVLLDEPTSALDPIAEHKMYERMMKISENKSVVFISHRLSSAVVADRIYMLEHGEVIESGTHQELMALNGKYADMFRKQAENYGEEEIAS
ncbi:MAG: ABC transporter ATP-binding protein [Clostridia bacterium]|nr:ABC transporter ATP-binding protein [Clostridia bacterium]